MMDKKFWLGVVVVFVVQSVLSAIVNMGIMSGDYAATQSLWRPMEEMMYGVFHVVYFVIAFFFTTIFTCGYEGNGVVEGARYGFFVGMLMAVPMAFATYASMPISFGFALKWFFAGLIEYIIMGIALAAVYGKTPLITKVKPA